MPDWAWSPRWKRYRNMENGQWASRRQIEGWVGDAVELADSSTDELSRMIGDTRIDARSWHTLMRDQIKEAYKQQYILGRGGIEQMTAQDWGSVGGMIADQYRYLDRFAQQIADGKLSEGGPRSGWFAPPKGTHGPGSQGGKIAKTDDEYASEIIDEQIEYGIATKDGREILRRTGEMDYIEFTSEEVALFVDAKFIHNHPSGSQLSYSDVQFAIENDLAEVQAVAWQDDGQFLRTKVVRGEGGWPSVPRAAGVMNARARELRAEMRSRINRDEITETEAEDMHFSIFWDLVDDELGFHYTEEVVDFDADTN